jgi:3-deoxy-manno-octulosonate cytidylyltransferase (CMP-KDO synthetase)
MILGVIPARYASTRFPGKPLVAIAGKSMVQRVYERAANSRLLDRVVVATDDERIFSHVEAFGGTPVMTAPDHISGTDRCYEALNKSGCSAEFVINIQGDEPFLATEQIDELARLLQNNPATELATQMIAVKNEIELFDPGEVKIILNKRSEALCFSRSPIPFLKGIPKEQWHQRHTYYRHVGLYAYRSDILRQITALPESPLEKAESLEQLRWLENGFRIRCILTAYESHCVDTPEDLERVMRMMGGGNM